MALDENKVANFLDSAARSARVIMETVEEDGLIQVFSHLDADGVAAAGIIGNFAVGRYDRLCRAGWI